MVRVHIVLSALAVCVATAGVALSQPPDRRAGRGGEEQRPANGPGAGPVFRVLPPFAQRELGLTPEQQQQIESLEAEVQGKMEKILTPEQLKQWNERRPARSPRGDSGPGTPGAGRRDRSNDNRGGRPGGTDGERPGATGTRAADDRREGSQRGDRADGPLHRVIRELKLTPEQQAKVDTALNEHREKVRGLFRQAQADLVARMKEVLTDEQFQQFTKALENGPPGSRRRERPNDSPRSERQPAQP